MASARRAAAAAIASLGIGTRLLPLYTGNNDEPVYVFQARTIQHGHLTVYDLDHLGVRQSPFATFIDYRVKR